MEFVDGCFEVCNWLVKSVNLMYKSVNLVGVHSICLTRNSFNTKKYFGPLSFVLSDFSLYMKTFYVNYWWWAQNPKHIYRDKNSKHIFVLFFVKPTLKFYFVLLLLKMVHFEPTPNYLKIIEVRESENNSLNKKRKHTNILAPERTFHNSQIFLRVIVNITDRNIVT